MALLDFATSVRRDANRTRAADVSSVKGELVMSDKERYRQTLLAQLDEREASHTVKTRTAGLGTNA